MILRDLPKGFIKKYDLSSFPTRTSREEEKTKPKNKEKTLDFLFDEK